MNYPLISEYVEAIKSAEDNFEELSYLRPVLGDDGLPVMTSGNFAVVFKMKDEQSGKLYAVKCFTKEQEGRAESYKRITEELNGISTSYLTPLKYLENELFVDSKNSNDSEFPVLLMDWVDGMPLDKYLRQNLKKKKTLEKLVYNFYQCSKWLISQPFAHGDLKPDNILVKKDGNIVLVDYDGMYVPAMKGQKSRELGSPDFCHPLRNENYFDGHIDDFSILSILLSLCVLFVKPGYLKKYGAEDRLLFSKSDYIDIHNSSMFKSIPSVIKTSTNYKLLFEKACINSDFQLEIKSLTSINKLFSAITLQKEAKDNLKEETGSIDDVKVAFVTIRDDINVVDPDNWSSYIRPIRKTLPRETSTVDQKKQSKSTRWQAALLLQILTALYIFFIVIDEHNSDGIWTAMAWGFGVGLIAWFFAFFDYIKRDGSFGNCFFAFMFFPITLYYGIYSAICMCIDEFKERRNRI